jgi:YidC/Oxa1 family membrane protein insertase
MKDEQAVFILHPFRCEGTMRSKDLLRFVIVSALFLLGLYLLSRNLTPPQPERDKSQEGARTEKQEARAEPLGAAAGFGGHLALKQRREPVPRERQQARAEPLGAVAGFGGHIALKQRERESARSRPTITLGSLESDSPFHLQVIFDPRGACVRRLVLNKFKAADKYGRPAKGDLELIADQAEVPEEFRIPEEFRLGAFVLYHYDIDKPTAERPLDRLGKINWDVEEVKKPSDEEQSARFSTTIQGVKITKTFRLSPRTYHLGLDVKLQRTTSTLSEKFRYQLSGPLGLPVEGRWYATTHRHALIGRLSDDRKSLWREYEDVLQIANKQGGEPVSSESDRRLHYAGIGVQFFASVIVVDDQQKATDFLASARPTLEASVVTLEAEESVRPGDREITVTDKRDRSRPRESYKLTDEVALELAVKNLRRGQKISLLCVPDMDNNLWAVKVLPEGEAQPVFHDDITVRVNTEPLDLQKESEIEHHYLLYNGPVKAMLLGQMRGEKAVEEGLVDRYVHTLHLNTLTDYRSPGLGGSIASKIFLTNLIIFFTNLCHHILGFLYWIIPSHGICIVLLTVLVRGIMFPLSRKQAQTSLKMQALAPELKKLKEKFGDDRQAFAMAQMELFRKHGVNPLGTCWMLLLQLPIFMGLYYCLQESVQFRLGSFLWIENLAAPDMLLWWSERIPWISRPEDYGGFLYLGPYLNILPIIAVTLMLYSQSKMMPPPADEQAAMQQKMMKYMMILFALFFYKMAAGLCIYFIATTLWGMAERRMLPKKKPTTDGETADSLFEKMRAQQSAPAPKKEEPRQAPNGQGVTAAASNRAKRRQERKRRQEAARSQLAAGRKEETPDGEKPQTPGGAQGPSASWWSRLREWWQDVLKKASKK